MNKQYDPEVFSAMQTGDPVATYQKTILAKVSILVLNPFTGAPEELLLYGKPGEEESIIRTWSVAEDVFFKRMNKRHFTSGVIIKKESTQVVEETTSLEQSSDEDLLKVVNSKFYALQSVLNKTESEALVNRILTIAREQEKSEKIIKAIETRLAEIQSAQLPSME